MDIQETIDCLKEKSTKNLNGNMGESTYIDKSILSKAVVHLEDYLYWLEWMSTQSNIIRKHKQNSNGGIIK